MCMLKEGVATFNMMSFAQQECVHGQGEPHHGSTEKQHEKDKFVAGEP